MTVFVQFSPHNKSIFLDPKMIIQQVNVYKWYIYKTNSKAPIITIFSDWILKSAQGTAKFPNMLC